MWDNMTSQLTKQIWDNMTSQSTNQTPDLKTWNNENPNGIFEGRGPLENFDLIDAFRLTTGFLVIAAGTLCNSVIMEALLRMPTEVLKPKAVLINIVIANCLPLFSYCTALLGDIFSVFQFQTSCLTSLRVIVIPMFQYTQAFAYLFLSLDRLYSITAPLRYRLQTSSTFGMVAVALTWSIPVLMTLPGFIAAGVVPDPLGYCHQLRAGPLRFLVSLRLPLITGLKVSAFGVYIFVFLYLKYSRKFVSSCTTTAQRKDDLSMAVTFFVIHVLSLASYIIGPLYILLNPANNVLTSADQLGRIHRVFILVNLLNTIVDPVLTGRKILVIRKQILKMWKIRHA